MKNPRYWDMLSCGEPYLDLFIAIVKLAHSDAQLKKDWLHYDAKLFLRWAEEEIAPIAAIPMCRHPQKAATRWAPDDSEIAQRARLARATKRECNG